jgi:hypothetical protein
MEHSPSWEANRFAASQEIPHNLWNPKVHYLIHKWPPPVSWASSIQSIPPHPIYRRSILILSYHLCLGLPSVLLQSGFPIIPLYNPSPLRQYALHARPSHSSQFYHLYNSGWRVQIMKLIMKFSSLPFYVIPLRPKYSPQHMIDV